MFGRNPAGGPVRDRNGLVSRVLLQKGGVPGVRLTATRGDVDPGTRQRLHDHDAEQVYVVLEGRGKTRVGEEEQEVGRGVLSYIPSGAAHGIENASGPLVYVPAGAPAMDALAAYDTGRLRPGGDGRE